MSSTNPTDLSWDIIIYSAKQQQFQLNYIIPGRKIMLEHINKRM